MVFLYKPHARRSRSGRQYAHHKSKKRGFQTLATYQPLSKTYVFVLEAYGYVRPFDSFFPGGLSSRPALSPGCEAQLCRRASTRRSRERVLFRNGRSGSSLGGGGGGITHREWTGQRWDGALEAAVLLSTRVGTGLLRAAELTEVVLLSCQV